ncbi:hypothetical protein [Paraburkholderia franconis]|uniref:hypothetical protein n=1 Tax=Paraburkholderia franconis TaxID=2654983 RepID=UPI00187BBE15|nr:hypothetical protein [Paraburkholderia franconis]
MSFFKSLALVTAISVACSVGNAVAAEQKATDAEHKAHHPPATKPVSKDSKKLRDIDEQTKHMQAMHEKMMDAKTSEQRAALMDEQMKSTQSSMHMMDMMKQDSEAMPMSGQAHEMMMKRMDMMQMMLQAMMDRQSAQDREPVK